MSTLLEQASLVMIPSGYKEDTVYSVVPSDGSGDLSFTRASNGTRVNSAGLVEDCPWNLLEQSEDFTNAYWNKYQSVITANATTAPNGTTTADKLEYTTTGTAVLFATSSALQNQVYALSCYGKQGTTNILQIGFTLSGGDKIANFNLNTGVISTTSSGVTASIESVGDGWYRCIMSLTTDINTPNVFINSTSGTTGQFIYIWGAQLNIGSTAKPYFPTTDRLNVPRLTYQNGGGGCPSLLLEKQSTNIVLYSEQFDNANWTKGNSTITANATTSPDGTTNADKLIADTTNNFHSLSSGINNTAAPWTYSIFAKAAGYDRLIMWVASTNFVGFNLTSGTIESSIGTNLTSANIENYGNGWYRCTITSTSTTSGTAVALAVYNTTYTNGNVNPIFTGNGTDGIFIYGAQLEASSYPTSYIPTTSASATRVSDACVKTGASALIGQSEGTIFLDFVVNGQSVAANSVNIYNNDFAANTISTIAITYTNGTLGAYSFLGNGTFDNVGVIGTGYSIGQRIKLAYRYKSGDFALYINGVQKQTSSLTMTFNGTKTEIYLNALNVYYGYPDAVKYNEFVQFKTGLSNADLQALTS